MPKFVPRQRKHKVLARQKGHGGHGPQNADSNAAELLPAPKGEKEERRQQLKTELHGQSVNISSKKKKRLDKYIVSMRETYRTLLRLTGYRKPNCGGKKTLN